MATPARSKPQLAAKLLDAAPNLHALAPEDAPEVVSISGSGLSCDSCGDPAEFFDGRNIRCGACQRKAEL